VFSHYCHPWKLWVGRLFLANAGLWWIRKTDYWHKYIVICHILMTVFLFATVWDTCTAVNQFYTFHASHNTCVDTYAVKASYARYWGKGMAFGPWAPGTLSLTVLCKNQCCSIEHHSLLQSVFWLVLEWVPPLRWVWWHLLVVWLVMVLHCWHYQYPAQSRGNPHQYKIIPWSYWIDHPCTRILLWWIWSCECQWVWLT